MEATGWLGAPGKVRACIPPLCDAELYNASPNWLLKLARQHMSRVSSWLKNTNRTL